MESSGTRCVVGTAEESVFGEQVHDFAWRDGGSEENWVSSCQGQ